MSVQWEVVAAYIVGLVLLYVLGWLLLVPLKFILKLLLNGVIGGAALWALNWLGALVGLSIAINPLNALITGFFGIPGVLLLLVLQNVL